MKSMRLRKIMFLSVIILVITFLVGCGVYNDTDKLGNEIIVIDRVAFNILGRNIYWYAICIITGITLAYVYALYIAKKIGFKEEDLFDGFIIGAILGIVGARLYYVIFSWRSGGFNEDPLRIVTDFFNEQGGLAIHGAVIAAGTFAYFFAKKRKIDLFKLGEMLFPGFLIGQIAGRWGNFFNKEAHGGPIASTLEASRNFLENLHLPKFIIDQMYIYENGKDWYMHPTFLYESIWNLIGLLIIIITRKNTKKYWMGDAVLFYLVWYGIGRFMIESLRTDALMFFGLRIAQIVSLIMIIAGITLFILRRVYKYHAVSYIETVEQNK